MFGVVEVPDNISETASACRQRRRTQVQTERQQHHEVGHYTCSTLSPISVRLLSIALWSHKAVGQSCVHACVFV